MSRIDLSDQLPGIHPLNQRCKVPVINAYIQWALAKSRSRLDDPVSFTELSCADGSFTRARRIASRLGLDRVEFVTDDVNNATWPADC